MMLGNETQSTAQLTFLQQLESFSFMLLKIRFSWIANIYQKLSYTVTSWT